VKKYLIILLVLVFSISILGIGVGCKEEAAPAEEEAVEEAVEEEAPAEEEEAEEAPAEEEEAAEEVSMESVEKLTIWYNPDAPKEINMLADGFQEKTGIEVEVVTIPAPFPSTVLTKWAAGERPDILNWHTGANRLYEVRAEETLQDLSDMEFVGKTMNNYLDATSLDGKCYGTLLLEPMLIGFWYNKQVFERAGINMPADTPVGHEGLLALCEKLKDAGEVPIHSGGGDTWTLQIIPILMLTEVFNNTDIGNELNTNQTTYTDERIVQAFEKLKEIHDMGYVNDDFLSATFADQQEKLWDGDAAMVPQVGALGDAIFANQEGGISDVIGYFPLSETGNTNVLTFDTGSMTMYAPKTGDPAQELAAREFIKYATSEGYQAVLDSTGSQPLLEGFTAPADRPQFKVEAYGTLDDYPNGQGFSSFVIPSYGPLPAYLSELVAGTKTAEEVGAAMQLDHEASAKEIGLEGF